MMTKMNRSFIILNLKFVVAVSVSQITGSNLEAGVPTIEGKCREEKTTAIESQASYDRDAKPL